MNGILHLLLVWFGLVAQGLSGRCPATWLEHPGGMSCYKLWPNAKKTWSEARESCQLIQSDLLKLNSIKEKEWIIGEIGSYPANLEWWIGLKRHEANESKWVWMDGETRNSSNKFIMWGSGEPNNHMKMEDCAEIWDNLLNDKNCDTRLQYICEQPIDTPRPCSNGWDDIYPRNNCYKLFQQKVSYEDAVSLCTRNDATLLSIRDIKEQKIFSAFLTELNISSWINLKVQEDAYGSIAWQWSEDNRKELDSPFWMNGKPNFEKVRAANTTCATMSPLLAEDKSYRSWKAVTCDIQHSVICEKIPISCPSGYYTFTFSKCLLMAVSDSLLPWNEARGFCNLRGTQLLEIYMTYEMEELNKLVSGVVVDPASRAGLNIWTGLTVAGLDGRWDSQRPLGEFEKQMLQLRNDTNGCVFLQFADCSGGRVNNCDANTLEWKVGSCTEDRLAFCTVLPNMTVTTPSGLKPKYVCPDQYKVIDNTCIRRHYGDPADWFSARTSCRQDGSDLATVHSATKLQFLQDKALGRMWIGLNDLQQENKFMWSDETTVYGGEMNQSLNINNYVIGDRFSENCIVYIKEAGSKQWLDVPCNFKNSFYCQVWAEWNIAFGKNGRQSSVYGDHRSPAYSADKAIDGCTTMSFARGCCTHTLSETTPWWELDLGTVYPIRKVIVHRRFEEGCNSCKSRMHNFRLFISNVTDTTTNPVFQDRRPEPPTKIIMVFPEIQHGRFVRIDVPNSNQPLTLCEVEVFQDDLNTLTNDKTLTEENSNCYMNPKTWKGNVRHGISGRECQEWVLNTPHEHTRHNDASFIDGSQREASNYCRDPDGEGRPWCYTVDPSVRWEYCPIPHCHTIMKDDPGSKSIESAATDCGSSDWVEDGTGMCYQLQGPYTAADAQTFCRAVGGNLATANNDNEQRILVDMVRNKTMDSLIWLGIYYSSVTNSWHTVDGSTPDENFVSRMINKTDMEGKLLRSSGTVCIGIRNLEQQQSISKWTADQCLNRHHFVCKKKGKYIKFFTPNETEVPILDNPSINMLGKTSLLFEFRGKSGARIIMKNTVVKGQTPLVINIGYEDNTKSAIVTKYKSVNGIPAKINDTYYAKFWISWSMNGIIKIGYGTSLEDNMFLTETVRNFTDFDYVALSVTGNDAGYWKFPLDTKDGRKRKNLAYKKPTWQSSAYSDISTAERGVDGCTKNDYRSGCCIHTISEARPWWEVDLGRIYNIREIVMTKRWKCDSCRERMNRFNVHINNTRISDSAITDDTIVYSRNDMEPLPVVTLKTPRAKGRFVLLQLPHTGVLEFCELEIYEDVDAIYCKSGWTNYDGRTCLYVGTTMSDWNSAQSQCKHRDPESDLVVMKSSQQEMFIYEMVANVLPASEKYRFWIGLKNESSGAAFWSDGSTTNYTRLGPVQQNGNTGCYMVSYGDPDSLGWEQVPCASSLYYICSKTTAVRTTTALPSTTTTTTITTTTKLTTLTTPQAINTTVGLPDARNELSTTPPNKESCPVGWEYNKFEPSCIYIGRSDKKGISFMSAERKCLSMQALLASITSKDEQSFYRDLLLKDINKNGKYKDSWDAYWIGAIDIEAEGSWRWFLYDEPWYDIAWSKGQPDNYKEREDCAMMRTHLATLGEGNDGSCNYDSKGFICKKQLSDYSCSTGWFYDARTQTCYLVKSDNKTWVDAQSICKGTYRADLASIVNNKEQEFIGVILDGDRPYWVGARTDPKDDTWWWSDKSRWWMRVNWGDVQLDHNKACGAVERSKGLLTKTGLINKNCKETLPFVCKRKALKRGQGNTTPAAGASENPPIADSTPMEVPTPTLSTLTPTAADTQCGAGWEKRPHSRYCYKFGTDLKTWMESKDICIQAGGNLSSITTNEEQQYISGRLNGMRNLPIRMWIGAHDREFEGKWTWLDGSPFAYFNWAIGDPNDNGDAEDCVAAITGKALYNGNFFGMWNDIGCEVVQGYICKKTAVEVTTLQIPTVTTVKQDGVLYGCGGGKGWLEYGPNSCYQFVQDSVTWDVASISCRLQGGDLASIADQQEQDFIFSQLPQDIYCFNTWGNVTECDIWAQKGECSRNPIWMATHCHKACNACLHHCRDLYVSSEKCLVWANQGECDKNPDWMKVNCAAGCGICKGAPTNGFWIGLYSDKGSHQYEWSDRSTVTYTNWDYSVKQPKYFGYAAGSCGGLFIQTGTWNDGPCSEQLQGYVCKKKKQPLTTTIASPFQIGCSEENSYGYEAYCYTYIKERKTFSDAQKHCVGKGGHLAYIKNRYVQSFISSELVNLLQNYWIGIMYEQSQLKWANKSPVLEVKYINFDKAFNFSESVTWCFAMRTFKPVGLWAQHDCNESLPFICQLPRDGFSTTQTTTPLPDLPCQSGWKEFNGNCYLFSAREVLTWPRARQKCSQIFATLVTIESGEENQFIKTNMLEVSWLGLHDTGDEGRWELVDGKPFVYSNWNSEEPNNAGNEDCACIKWNGKWNDLPCDLERNFICKAPKGKLPPTTTPPATTTTIIPASTTPDVCAKNDDGGSAWRSYNNSCYKLFERATWHEGKQQCRDHGGYLISIHSRGELDFILDLIKNAGSDLLWTGFNDLDVDGVFSWSDGSVTDYTNWYPGQPNDGNLYNGEKCVSIDTNHNGNKCYFIGGKDGVGLKDMFKAKEFCQNANAVLTSIHSIAENGFINSLLEGSDITGFWIGLVLVRDPAARFAWIDNSVMDSVNWGANEPSTVSQYYRHFCVEMYNQRFQFGLWNDVDCDDRKGFICSSFKSVEYPEREPDDDCPAGYRSYRSHCYKLLSEKASWDKAQSKCIGGNLVAVTDVYEKAFVQTFWSEEKTGPIWVGMKLHRYGVNRWANGVIQTFPEIDMLLRRNPVGCLYLDGHNVRVLPCDQQFYGLCQINKGQTTTAHTTLAEERICSDRELFLYNGHCYYVSTAQLTFSRAHAICLRKKMEFVSIHSFMENSELANMVYKTATKSKSRTLVFFIGMYYENRRDTLPKWIDHSKVDYLQLPPLFFQLRNSINVNTTCFTFDPTSKDKSWAISDCNQPSGFICKMKADAPQTTVITTPTTTEPTTSTTTPTTTSTTTESTTTPTTTPSSTTTETTYMPYTGKLGRRTSIIMKDDSLSHSQIAAIVVGGLAFILLIVVVGYLLHSGYMKRYFYKVQDSPSMGFDNALFQRGEDAHTESVKFD